MSNRQVMTYDQKLPIDYSGHQKGPWGNQGIVLDKAPTSAEAIKQAGLDWNVELRPVLYQADKQDWSNPNTKYRGGTGFNAVEYTDKKVVVRTDNDEALSIVGNKWRPLQNANAFEFFDPFVEQGLCEYSTAGYINDGERVWVMAKILADPIEVIKGDPIDSFILLTNMHSAVACGRAIFTNIRFFCTNVLPAMAREDKFQKIFHTGDVIKSIGDVQKVIDLRRGDFSTTLEQYRLLAKKEVNAKTFQHYLKMVLANDKPRTSKGDEPWKDKSSHRNTINRISQLFETGRATDIKGVRGTLWGAFNAVVEFYDYHQGRKLDNRLASVFYGQGRKKTEKALSVALNMVA